MTTSSNPGKAAEIALDPVDAERCAPETSCPNASRPVSARLSNGVGTSITISAPASASLIPRGVEFTPDWVQEVILKSISGG